MRNNTKDAGPLASTFFRLPWRRSRAEPEFRDNDAGAQVDGHAGPNRFVADTKHGTARVEARVDDAEMRRKQVAAEFIERAVAAVRRPQDVGGRSHHQLRDREHLTRATFDEANSQILRTVDGLMPGPVPREFLKLRYDVFCAERQFIEPKWEQRGVETDKYDACSIDFGVYDLANVLMGTVRLVRPNGNAPYPFEVHCPTFPTFGMPPRNQCAEISRLAVARCYRRRRADSWSGIPGSNNVTGISPRLPLERRVSEAPMALLGLYREMYRQSVRSGIYYWYAAMERSLAHSLSKLGIDFEPIGPLAEYYGVVMPFVTFGNRRDILEITATK